MRKLFFAFCFISILFCSISISSAAITSIVGKPDTTKAPIKDKKTTKEPPTFKTKDDFIDYIDDRMKYTVVTEIPPEEFENSSSTSILPSDEEIAKIKGVSKTEKSFFQEVYEKAIERVSNSNQNNNKSTITTTSNVVDVKSQKETWETPNYPTVNVTMPNGKKILAPAIEHIPYFMSDIEILSTGIIKIHETIVVVANGEKLREGLHKGLPKFSYSRSGEKTNLIVNIAYTKVNGKEIEYKIEEVGNLLIFSPKKTHVLEPGVYTYEFEYIVDRQITDYDDFREFFWNITGSNWNLIAARVGATVSLPANVKELGHNMFISDRGKVDVRGIRFFRANQSTIGFVSTRPIFVGESMDIIISMGSDGFMPTDIDKKINNIIDDYGDIILSSLGLLAIVGAYFVSWIFISDKNVKPKYSIEKTGTIIRYLIKGVFDKTSFGCFILELYKRNIIDIKDNSLIKLRDNIEGFSKKEKEAINNLFPNRESSIKITRENMLKINRAYKLAEEATKEKIKSFLLKINSGYIIFSFSMLLLSQLGIAMLGYSVKYNMAILLTMDILLVVAFFFIFKIFKNKFLKILVRLFAVILILVSIFVMTSILLPVSAILTVLTIYVIFVYTNMFSKRNGLIKNNIREAKAMRDLMIRNVESVSFPRNFISQQPIIFALELDSLFEERMKESGYCRLKEVKEIINNL